jgi:hypothetical protein
MEILVNEEPLDYTLERESSLGDVIDGLTEWLQDGQFAITGIDVDRTPVQVGDRSTWEDISIESVGQLRVEALPLSRVDQTTLAAVDEYFQILDNCIRTGNGDALADAATELPFVRERLATYFPQLADSTGHVPVLSDLENEQQPVPDLEARTAGFLHEIASVRAIVQTRMREYDSPSQELTATLQALRAALPGLTEIPVWLQTNRQKDAMTSVVALTELLGKAVRLTPLVEAETSDSSTATAVRTAARELGPFLVELSEALESGDTVLVGDLLEYEVAPILQRLVEQR